jgi:Asp/Glu/hydantoin racemase
MSKTLAMIYTVSSIVREITDLCKEILHDVELINIIDEAMLRVLLKAGGLIPWVYRRVGENVVCAEAAGADAILLTCSTISPCASVVKQLVSVPVLRIDQPMVDKAVSISPRIGVAATAVTTLKPTCELVEERSCVAGRQVKIDSVLCEGAYQALLAGEMEKHDQIVLDYLRRLMRRNDVIILAQASMARVSEQIPEPERLVPILSSPRLGIEQVREVLDGNT